jgi:hypothetical protein
MKFFYDTEFHEDEDGSTIDLISIGIVAEDGREFYAVNLDADWSRIHAHTWLEANVVPLLPSYGNKSWQTRAQIRAGVRQFLTGNVELWADYSAYDHVALAQLFGTMMDLPRGIPMFTNDVRAMAGWLGASERSLPPQFGSQHDALADARHVKAIHDYLHKLKADVYGRPAG